MAVCAVEGTKQKMTVGMGQVVVARDPVQLTSILGSCVCVSLYHKRLRLGAMAHVVLPDSNGRTGSPGKYADTAIPHMLQQLQKLGVGPSALVVKLAGGAQMFAASGPLQVGQVNIEAVTRILRSKGLTIAADDLAGKKGRRTTLDCSSGNLTIEIIGQPTRLL